MDHNDGKGNGDNELPFTEEELIAMGQQFAAESSEVALKLIDFLIKEFPENPSEDTIALLTHALLKTAVSLSIMQGVPMETVDRLYEVSWNEMLDRIGAVSDQISFAVPTCDCPVCQAQKEAEELGATLDLSSEHSMKN